MIELVDNDIDELLLVLNQNRASPLVLDPSRRQALCGNHDVQACPGSGKTTLVGLKLLCFIRKWTAPRRGICVLTHTNIARDEILKCLSGHPSGFALRSYPHFIGTIQEFVNTYIALPALRSKGMTVTQIDDDHCVDRLEQMALPGTKTYLANRHASISELRYRWEHNSLILKTPAFQMPSQSASYTNLLAIKARLQAEGSFFYSEMYAYAQESLFHNPQLVDALRYRFPVVLIDEMQDVQGFQDELVSAIFDHADVHYQRFGDPDQSIFDGVGGELPNISYNSADMQPIVESHRYCPAIAVQLGGLSSRKLVLTTSREPAPGDPSNAIILFSNDTRAQVLDCFAGIVQTLPASRRLVVKAVGGVAENSGDAAAPLNIKSYWPDFQRNLQPQNPKPDTLCQAVGQAISLRAGGQGLSLILDAIVSAFRLAGIRFISRVGVEKPPSRSGLADHLRSKQVYGTLRQMIAEWVVGDDPSEEQWNARVEALRALLELPGQNAGLNSFLAYGPAAAPVEAEIDVPINTYISEADVKIELATIHSVKGETHDATLLLETKYRTLFDLKEMIPHIMDHALPAPVFDPAHQTTHVSIRASFMKKAYVAASRPRHVLALAMGRDRITPAQRQSLVDAGWNVIDLG
ncbi:UvrD-helicase domain-containing protein [Rhizobium sp. P38BS-XIX]|uniref:UvrD-helicase domain-containing protein n=1 Tax=Rhizobium sp. P38BS-XIX TaxID=2726740 RepID=UPI001456AAAF|nr:UvrD-helicase domain-containing protein [Rhizobium sp. P38BS-XIX]NLR97449.1 UvrD-helicase domain-containing protein [Rhizobium sp. P38BS-XIX]